MTADYPVDQLPATPEYVLEVFRDWTRMTVDEKPYPNVDTPLRDWLDYLLLDHLSTERLRQGINATWCADITADEWGRFDWGYATVGDLCRVVAAFGRRPVFRPWRSPIGECVPAGAFLTVRSLLAAAGADLRGILPSAPLAPYHRRLAELDHKLGQFAPGWRPRFVTNYPSWVVASGCIWAVFYVLTIPAGAVLLALGLRDAANALALAVLARTVGLGVVMRLTRIDRIEPEEVRTFRDLAYALSGEQPRQQLTSSRRCTTASSPRG